MLLNFQKVIQTLELIKIKKKKKKNTSMAIPLDPDLVELAIKRAH